MQNIQRRLALIESKTVIRESLASKYYLNESYFIQDEYGNIVTDLTTISVINEAAANGDVDMDEGIWSDAVQGLAKYGKNAYQGAKDLVGGAVKGAKAPAAAEKLAGRASTTGAKKAGLKAGAAVGRNPGKAALGAAAVGGGLGYALTGDEEKQDTPPPISIGGGGGGGGDIAALPSEPENTPEPEKTELTADQKALIAQIREIMGHDYGEDQKWDAAVSHAQEVLDRAEGANALQLATDRGHASGAASALAMNDNKPKPNNIAAMPSGNTARADYDKFKQDDAIAAARGQVRKMTTPQGGGNFIDPKDGVIKYLDQGGRGEGGQGVKEFSYDWYKQGQEKPFFDTLAAAGLKVVPVEKKQLFGTFQVAGVDPGKLAEILADIKPVKENNDELDRWLKIARG
jgi:hypothetical protein